MLVLFVCLLVCFALFCFLVLGTRSEGWCNFSVIGSIRGRILQPTWVTCPYFAPDEYPSALNLSLVEGSPPGGTPWILTLGDYTQIIRRAYD